MLRLCPRGWSVLTSVLRRECPGDRQAPPEPTTRFQSSDCRLVGHSMIQKDEAWFHKPLPPHPVEEPRDPPGWRPEWHVVSPRAVVLKTTAGWSSRLEPKLQTDLSWSLAVRISWSLALHSVHGAKQSGIRRAAALSPSARGRTVLLPQASASAFLSGLTTSSSLLLFFWTW